MALEFYEVAVSAAQETATNSLIDARRRLNETKAEAGAANERLFDVLLNTDPEDESLDAGEQINAELKITKAEEEADVCWKRYERAIVKYRWEFENAKRLGLMK